MSLPKLAYLTGEYPRASDTFIQREVAALRGLGHEVDTCSIRTTGAEHLVGPEQREEHARTFRVLDTARHPARLIKAHLRCLQTPGRYLSALKLAWQTAPKGIKGRLYNLIYFLEAGVLADHLRDQRVGHLHNHIAKASCTVAMLASELSGIPYSFTIHGPDIFFEPHHWRIDEKARRAAFVACISDFCRSQLMCFTAQEHWPKMHIIHCGIDPDRYSPAPHTGKRLLFVGRLAAVKGMPVLLEALRDLPGDWHLTVIGDGPDRAALEAQAQGMPVEFLGYRSQAEVAEALHATDVFVLPSFAEGVPVVLMEAMASGVPVVTTRIAGIPELVDEGVSGYLVPPGDAGALRKAIDRALSDRDKRREMGAQGRARVVADFNLSVEPARLSRLFRESSETLPTSDKRPEPAR
ncbi:glycosyltransferase family 4 protein [Antarctobacter jejuensis]|uniref:glycosyltransferase family 4 protein n=1 Tax=Antarctobacter jejuensis TaxID=1439938 RepID=UPI003FD4A9F5